MTANLRLVWTTHRGMQYACEHWHYTKSVPTPPTVQLAAFEGHRVVGVVVFSRGANKHLYRPYGLKQTEGAELTRVALRDHKTPTSRIVAIAFKMLEQHCPGLRLVVSFADPAAGHVGTLYQALGGIYVGTTEPSEQFRDDSGRLWHRRMISATGIKTVYGRKRRVLRLDQVERVPMPGKYRYLFPLDAETRERLIPLSQPYPRRRSIESDAPSDQLGTRALRNDPAAPSLPEGRGGEHGNGGLVTSSHPALSLQGLR